MSDRLFWRKVRADGDCWRWTGAVTSRGYGCLGRDGRTILAHRYAYVLTVGPIPDGLTIDHLCGNKRCVRPEHMEPVTGAENTRRRFRGKTHGPGDPVTPPRSTVFADLFAGMAYRYSVVPADRKQLVRTTA